MADKKIEDGKLEEVTGAGGIVDLEEAPEDGGGLDGDKPDPPLGGGADPEAEGGGGGNEGLQI